MLLMVVVTVCDIEYYNWTRRNCDFYFEEHLELYKVIDPEHPILADASVIAAPNQQHLKCVEQASIFLERSAEPVTESFDYHFDYEMT